ncbi:MAG: hypothetical protein PHS07_01165, partial [Patescibacteria group bacterium]|nr:hypothetical protein [Patescibacteria group bacterium]
QTNTWQDTSLTCGTSYTYTIKYRNGDGTETETISTSQTTDECVYRRTLPLTVYVLPQTSILESTNNENNKDEEENIEGDEFDQNIDNSSDGIDSENCIDNLDNPQILNKENKDNQDYNNSENKNLSSSLFVVGITPEKDVIIRETLYAGNFIYSTARVSNLKVEQDNAVVLADYLIDFFGVEKYNRFFWSNISINGKKWWYQYVNAYIYGGYPLEAIKQSIKFGGKTVHPVIPWKTWKDADDYKDYIGK